MVHFPGDPGVALRHEKHLDRGDAATVSNLELGVHTGTHVDAPVHFLRGTAGVDELALGDLIGPARVVALPDAQVITAQDLARAEVAGGERILVRTRNSAHWSSDTFYAGYTHLDAGAARLLADRRVRMIGIDYLSIGGGADGPEVHRILLSAGVVIVEGLDLSRVDAGPYDLVCLPIKILACDGAPARAAVRRRATS
ncbi:MAG: cyclase family protein [Deltaproteobacteria bacterium]|nr:cyclase family protein [Deltaproteobacteria bacterium]MCW5802721.1 cyclase family protein [Deltaproteobacteria bacterium]